MIFGVGVFGKGLGHEVGALMMEKKRQRRTCFLFLCHMRPQRGDSHRQTGGNGKGGGLSPAPNHAVPLISDFSAFRTVRNTFLLFKPPSYGNLLQQPELGHQDI